MTMVRETERLNQITSPLLAWYDANRRALPWREEVSPYRTWVSEIMLQQTRVQAVLPYFQRFMEAAPDAAALAALPEQRLMALWQGLGYYSRARNLQRAAVVLAEQYGGALPCTYEELRALPGIGDWTGHYIAMRAMGWSDAFPATDLGVIKFLGTKKPKELVAAAEKWRPWRSYAVLNMWCFEQAQAEKEAAAKAAAPKKRGKKNAT